MQIRRCFFAVVNWSLRGLVLGKLLGALLFVVFFFFALMKFRFVGCIFYMLLGVRFGWFEWVVRWFSVRDFWHVCDFLGLTIVASFFRLIICSDGLQFRENYRWYCLVSVGSCVFILLVIYCCVMWKMDIKKNFCFHLVLVIWDWYRWLQEEVVEIMGRFCFECCSRSLATFIQQTQAK